MDAQERPSRAERELVDEGLLGVGRVELLVVLPGLQLSRLHVIEAVRGVEPARGCIWMGRRASSRLRPSG